jgi:hypothetical protein
MQTSSNVPAGKKEVLDRLVLLTLERLSCGDSGAHLNIIFTESPKHHRQVVKRVKKFPLLKYLRTVLVSKNNADWITLEWIGGEVRLSVFSEGEREGVELEGNEANMNVFMKTFRTFELLQNHHEMKKASSVPAW